MCGYGYSIAANGDGVERRRFKGKVTSAAEIVDLQGMRTEEGDSLELAEDGRTLLFDLSVGRDDDVIRFATEPVGSPISVALEEATPDVHGPQFFVGTDLVPVEERELEISGEPCAADVDFGRAPAYAVGKQGGIFIWRRRQSAGVTQEKLEPSDEILEDLKDLNYL
jgi:hypothetical protein